MPQQPDQPDQPDQPGLPPTVFDRSFLPPATCELVVLSDTHYLLHPELQGGEWRSIREFPQRAERALRLAAALQADIAVHLGDVTHEYPETGEAVRSRQGAKAQLEALGLRPYMAPGNMDIGDKPDPTSPAEWVTPETLAAWDAVFGRSWRSFDHHGLHGIILNSCILNGPLPEAEAQRRWLEDDLAAHDGERIFLFLHHPIFFVDPTERAAGMYNSLDDPARSWLLDLIRRHRVEMVFSGHTHFVAINHVGHTRLFTAPSTTTSRAGLVEAFTVTPPDRGRSDLPKLGFYLVRVGVDRADRADHPTSHEPDASQDADTPHRDASRVHLIRTGQDTTALDSSASHRRLLTLTSPDLPHSPLGIFASHPLGHMTPGPVIWPSVVRQRVRDDWRFAACLELGARRVRVPESDLDEPTEKDRLAVLRREGVSICPYWVWTDRLDLPAAVQSHREQLDEAELVLPGRTTPDAACLAQLARLAELGVPVTLSAAVRTSAQGTQYHGRTRVGFDVGELRDLDRSLERAGATLRRAVLRLPTHASPWDAVAELRALLPLRRIGALDLALDFPDQDEARHASLAAEALFAAATLAGSRLWLGPLLDLDRSMDVCHGLLDRLSNPRPAFNAVRTLNTVLFARPPQSGYQPGPTPSLPGARVLALRAGETEWWLCLPTESRASASVAALPPAARAQCYHLIEVTSRDLPPDAISSVTQALARLPALLAFTPHQGDTAP